MYKTITYEVKNSKAYIVVNRPEALNALNIQVLEELTQAFRSFELDENASVAILTGAGKAFVAGADIAAMSTMNPLEGRAMMIKGHNLMNYMESIEKPIIGAVNGFALGGGCELAMACDIRIASDKAKFGQPEVNLGIIPGFGGTQRLPRLVGRGMGKYLIFSADIIDSAEAYRIGLVEKTVPHDTLMNEAEALADKIASKALIAVGAAKRAINIGCDLDIKAASTLEIETFTAPFASQDKSEGMKAFLEKRPAKFKKK